jgi:hypothetical protein
VSAARSRHLCNFGISFKLRSHRATGLTTAKLILHFTSTFSWAGAQTRRNYREPTSAQAPGLVNQARNYFCVRPHRQPGSSFSRNCPKPNLDGPVLGGTHETRYVIERYHRGEGRSAKPLTSPDIRPNGHRSSPLVPRTGASAGGGVRVAIAHSPSAACEHSQTNRRRQCQDATSVELRHNLEDMRIGAHLKPRLIGSSTATNSFFIPNTNCAQNVCCTARHVGCATPFFFPGPPATSPRPGHLPAPHLEGGLFLYVYLSFVRYLCYSWR